MLFLALLFSLAVWAFIFWLCWWGLGKFDPPEPFKKGITLLLIIGSIVVVIGLLMGTIPPFPFITVIFS